MTQSTPLHFAVFPSSKQARVARAELDEALEGEVDLLTDARELAPTGVPLGQTMTRAGTILGASLVAGVALAVVFGFMWLGVGWLPMSVASPWATLAVVFMLAAILGGLAGALSYATRVRSDLRRMREMIRHGHGVLIIESERDLDGLLRERGAVRVGSFA